MLKGQSPLQVLPEVTSKSAPDVVVAEASSTPVELTSPLPGGFRDQVLKRHFVVELL